MNFGFAAVNEVRSIRSRFDLLEPLNVSTKLADFHAR